jgi:hypothetical protein
MFQMILTCAVKRDRPALFGSSPEAQGRQHAKKTRVLNVYWHVCSNKRLQGWNGSRMFKNEVKLRICFSISEMSFIVVIGFFSHCNT